ncbi:hypothetical protein HYU40_03920 [Candidatus Woesearchaeota archaeon]|nr:hypothetical protein [Candidatus Woesearchaeota archaeon]
MNEGNKRVLLLVVIAAVMFLSLSATVAAQRENFWKRTSDSLLSIAQLNFLDNDAAKLAGFMRIMVWIVVFTVVWTALRRLGGGAAGAGMFAGGASMAIAMVFATVGSIFISPQLLIGIGESYSTVVAAALVGFLAIGLLAFLYGGLPTMVPPGRILALTRLVFIILLLYILDHISGFVADKFTGGGGTPRGFGILTTVYFIRFSDRFSLEQISKRGIKLAATAARKLQRFGAKK